MESGRFSRAALPQNWNSHNIHRLVFCPPSYKPYMIGINRMYAFESIIDNQLDFFWLILENSWIERRVAWFFYSVSYLVRDFFLNYSSDNFNICRYCVIGNFLASQSETTYSVSEYRITTSLTLPKRQHSLLSIICRPGSFVRRRLLVVGGSCARTAISWQLIHQLPVKTTIQTTPAHYYNRGSQNSNLEKTFWIRDVTL